MWPVSAVKHTNKKLWLCWTVKDLGNNLAGRKSVRMLQKKTSESDRNIGEEARRRTEHDISSVSQKMSLFISLIPQKLKVVFSSTIVQTIRPTMEIYSMHITIIAHVSHLRYVTCSRWLPFRRWQTFTRFITPSMARAHMAAWTDRTARLIAVFSLVRLLGSSFKKDGLQEAPQIKVQRG